ncbi:diguanylate cyclase [Sphingomonas sp. dw_22]|uniref:diguanylate cyclase n=1 Tax=Sphingomonas sp. dw_22 TaxID=2721175 RepID=UPI002116D816|nr:diguanylate cyclase [Sphingomonas sp. dw_22]
MSAYPWIEALQGRDADLGEITSLPASWECDLADNALRWAPGVFDLFGMPRGARLDRCAIVEMYVGESRAMLDRLRAEAIATCGSFTFDAQIRRPDGELRRMRLTADVLARGGRAVRLYGTKQDVTAEI